MQTVYSGYDTLTDFGAILKTAKALSDAVEDETLQVAVLTHSEKEPLATIRRNVASRLASLGPRDDPWQKRQRSLPAQPPAAAGAGVADVYTVLEDASDDNDGVSGSSSSDGDSDDEGVADDGVHHAWTSDTFRALHAVREAQKPIEAAIKIARKNVPDLHEGPEHLYNMVLYDLLTALQECFQECVEFSEKARVTVKRSSGSDPGNATETVQCTVVRASARSIITAMLRCGTNAIIANPGTQKNKHGFFDERRWSCECPRHSCQGHVAGKGCRADDPNEDC